MITRPLHLAGRGAVVGAALLLWLSGQAMAQASVQPSPRAVLEQASTRMVASLKADRAALRRRPAHIYDIVEQVLVPHVDLRRASRWALGRHWLEATPAQRVRFEHEFRTLLVRFYSTALVEYLNAGHEVPEGVISFPPSRNGADQGIPGDHATVRTLVRPREGRTIPVSYEMHRGPEGWKVCDVTVDGVSIISAYRSVFSTEIHKHGIDGLINTLATFNRRYAPKSD